MSRSTEATKNPGIPWVEKIPETWKGTRLGDVVKIIVSNVDKHTKEGEIPVRLCNYTDVYGNQEIDQSLEFMEATAQPREIAKFALHPNDVIATKDSEDTSDIAVSALVVESLNGVVCGYHLAILRPYADKLDGRFLSWIQSSRFILSQYSSRAVGITRYALAKSDFKEVRVPIPPLGEQARIAAYLDEETGKIERLVELRRRQIELLKEQRASLIQQAVTRGLNPNVKLKDSDIPWLGKIPEHWERVKLSRVYRYIGSGITPKSGAEKYYLEGTVPWVTSSALNDGVISESNILITESALDDYSGLRMLQPGTLLVGMYGQGTTKGKTGMLAFEATINQACCAFGHSKRLRNEFLAYWLQAWRPVILAMAEGGGQPNLNQEKLSQLHVSAPDVAEQDAIVMHLIAVTEKIDGLIHLIEGSIDGLAEYRAALINECVTGQRRVPA